MSILIIIALAAVACPTVAAVACTGGAVVVPASTSASLNGTCACSSFAVMSGAQLALTSTILTTIGCALEVYGELHLGSATANVTIQGDVTFYGGSTLTQSQAPTEPVYVVSEGRVFFGETPSAQVTASVRNLRLVASGDVDISSGTVFNANAKGFSSAQGAGSAATTPANTGSGGGGHAGAGGAGHAGSAGGLQVGDIELPELPGSAGGSNYNGVAAGAGGGALWISSDGTVTHNGTITVNGGGGAYVGGTCCNIRASLGGGAGGSVLIRGLIVTGVGSVSANGGDSTTSSGVNRAGGGGSGGRIAVHSQLATSASLTLTAVGGGGNEIGAAGTIYTSFGGVSTLRLDSALTSPSTAIGVNLIPTTTTTLVLTELRMERGAVARIPANRTIEATTTSGSVSAQLRVDGRLACAAGVMGEQELSYALEVRGELEWARDIVVSNGGSLDVVDGAQVDGLDGSVTIVDSMSAVTLRATANRGRVFDLSGSVSVASGGLLTVQQTDVTVGGSLWLDDGASMTLSEEPSYAAMMQLNVTGHVTLGTGLSSPSASTTVAVTNARMNVGGDVLIGEETTVTGDGRGYGSSSGPGGADATTIHTGSGGGGHAGSGGTGLAGTSGGVQFGDIEHPAIPGSGGGSNYNGVAAGAGGGAWWIESAGTLTHNGTVTMNGGTGVYVGGTCCGIFSSLGGGSGGSVVMIARQVVGSGSVTASGGSATTSSTNRPGGGGSGGRIAVHSQLATSASLTLTAVGGGGNEIGAAGTVYTSFGGVASLIIANGGVLGPQTMITSESLGHSGGIDLDSISVGAAAVVDIASDISVSSSSLDGDASALVTVNGVFVCVTCTVVPFDLDVSLNASLVFGSSLTVPADVTLTVQGVFRGDFTAIELLSGSVMNVGSFASVGSHARVTLSSGSLTVETSSTLNFDFASYERMTVVLQQNMSIAGMFAFANVSISAPTGLIVESSGQLIGVGVRSSQAELGMATGGSTSGNEGGGGGGHGGSGGDGWTSLSGGAPYGNATWPRTCGSPGGSVMSTYGGAGGGAIEVISSSAIIMNGTIVVDGGGGVNRGGTCCSITLSTGGGSGGSVLLTAQSIRGTGSISATGGSSPSATRQGGGGGGGRVCLHTVYSSLLTSQIDVTGGTGYQAGVDGSSCTYSPVLFCSETCSGGTCDADGLCQCPTGFLSPPLCNVPSCSSTCVFGACSAPNTCTCLPGYTGALCDTPTTECSSLPCSNGGTCVDLVDAFECVCASGFTDATCGTNINECASSPCLHSGNCTDLIDDFSCVCTSGYSGKICQQDVNECDSSPCQNQGVCANDALTNSITCTCSAGFTGHLCESSVDACASSPCMFSGQCTPLPGNNFNCSCENGRVGDRCQATFDFCSSSPCSTLGTQSCVVEALNFTCLCMQGFTGVLCDVDVNECDSSPCLHNGVCANQQGFFSCQCLPAYTGTQCQIEINECASAPCRHGGSCTDLIGGYTCMCVPNVFGLHCESDCRGNEVVTTQARVDTFAGCVVIEGYVTFSGAAVINLNSLSLLRTINGSLTVEGTSIQSIDTLSHLERVYGALSIQDNQQLREIVMSAFAAVEFVEGAIVFDKLPSLTNVTTPLFSLLQSADSLRFSSLLNLTAIDTVGTMVNATGIQSGVLIVATALTDVSFLKMTGARLDEMWITDNFELTSLDGFGSVELVVSRIVIERNAKLAMLTDDVLGATLVMNANANISIVDNDSLLSVACPLNAIAALGTLTIANNPLLHTVTGFAQLTVVSGSVVVSNNSALEQLHAVDVFPLLRQIDRGLFVEQNDALESLVLPPVSGSVFQGNVQVRNCSVLTEFSLGSTIETFAGDLTIAECDRVSDVRLAEGTGVLSMFQGNCLIEECEDIFELSALAIVLREHETRIVGNMSFIRNPNLCVGAYLDLSQPLPNFAVVGEARPSSVPCSLLSLLLLPINGSVAAAEATSLLLGLSNSSSWSGFYDGSVASQIMVNSTEAVVQTALGEFSLYGRNATNQLNTTAYIVDGVFSVLDSLMLNASLGALSSAGFQNALIPLTELYGDLVEATLPCESISRREKSRLLVEIDRQSDASALALRNFTSVDALSTVSLGADFASEALGAVPSSECLTARFFVYSGDPVPFYSVLGNQTQLSQTVQLAFANVSVNALSNTSEVLLTFATRTSDTVKECVFWREDEQLWSGAGCERRSSDETHTVCACNHLTNFAVLAGASLVNEDASLTPGHATALSALTYVGCVLSLLGALYVTVSYFALKGMHTQPLLLLVHLSVALFCSYLIFLIGIEKTANTVGCQIVGALLYFFLLASFMWMACVAHNLRFLLVTVFGSPPRTRTFVVCGWLVPLLLTVLVVVVDQATHSRLIGLGSGTDNCWFAYSSSLIGAFLVPTALIVVHNLVVFVLLVRQLRKQQQEKNSRRKSASALLRVYLGMSSALGISWLFAYIAVVSRQVAFWYLFVIAVCSQAILVAVFFAMNARQRKEWKERVAKALPGLQLVSSSGAGHGKKNSSRSTEHTSSASITQSGGKDKKRATKSGVSAKTNSVSEAEEEQELSVLVSMEASLGALSDRRDTQIVGLAEEGFTMAHAMETVQEMTVGQDLDASGGDSNMALGTLSLNRVLLPENTM